MSAFLGRNLVIFSHKFSFSLRLRLTQASNVLEWGGGGRVTERHPHLVTGPEAEDPQSDSRAPFRRVGGRIRWVEDRIRWVEDQTVA
jgi:hypothetical protein